MLTQPTRSQPGRCIAPERRRGAISAPLSLCTWTAARGLACHNSQLGRLPPPSAVAPCSINYYRVYTQDTAAAPGRRPWGACQGKPRPRPASRWEDARMLPLEPSCTTAAAPDRTSTAGSRCAPGTLEAGESGGVVLALARLPRPSGGTEIPSAYVRSAPAAATVHPVRDMLCRVASSRRMHASCRAAACFHVVLACGVSPHRPHACMHACMHVACGQACKLPPPPPGATMAPTPQPPPRPALGTLRHKAQRRTWLRAAAAQLVALCSLPHAMCHVMLSCLAGRCALHGGALTNLRLQPPPPPPVSSAAAPARWATRTQWPQHSWRSAAYRGALAPTASHAGRCPSRPRAASS